MAKSKLLVPAISKKEELQKLWYELYYTDEMFYCEGGDYMYPLDIPENNEHNKYAFAVMDSDRVIGYISYYFIPQQREVRGFMIISFDKGNLKFGFALNEIRKKLLSYNLHRVEWRMTEGNPIEKHYDRIIEKYHGKKIRLRDGVMDLQGNYHDDFIYEIILGDPSDDKGIGKEDQGSNSGDDISVYGIGVKSGYKTGIEDASWFFVQLFEPEDNGGCPSSVLEHLYGKDIHTLPGVIRKYGLAEAVSMLKSYYKNVLDKEG